MRRKRFIIGALFLCAFILSAAHCPQSPMAIYTGTRTAFNNYLETYLNYRDALPDGAQKDALKSKYEKRFEEAAELLNLWGQAVGTDSQVIKSRAFNALFDRILLDLMNAGIVRPVTRLQKEGLRYVEWTQ